MKLIRPMRFCLPCAIAVFLFDPPTIASSVAGAWDGKEFRKHWAGHVAMFSLLQHVPMFFGAMYYVSVVEDGGPTGRMEQDGALFAPIAGLSQQAAAAGCVASAAWFAVDFIWPRLRATNEVQFSPL